MLTLCGWYKQFGLWDTHWSREEISGQYGMWYESRIYPGMTHQKQLKFRTFFPLIMTYSDLQWTLTTHINKHTWRAPSYPLLSLHGPPSSKVTAVLNLVFIVLVHFFIALWFLCMSQQEVILHILKVYINGFILLKVAFLLNVLFMGFILVNKCNPAVFIFTHWFVISILWVC